VVDGELITADDFIFTYEMAIDPATRASAILRQCEKMESPDPKPW
jgi:hypothetical protein